MVQSRIPAADALLVAGAVALSLWTLHAYTLVSAAMVATSLALAGASLWSCRVLYGERTMRIFAAIAMPLGWFAEQMGSSRGWFFGSYTYTDVLGPRLGDVPVVIPLMWFGICHIGLVLASLALWRQPAPPTGDRWKVLVVAAFATAMVVTAFDLGADPYFVYQLKAWIMTKKDGGWFGETVKGFEGWMIVSFTIVALFLALARPQLVATPDARGRRAALIPILAYAFMMAFQLAVGDPIALRVISFYAMGLPLLFAFAAWSQWSAAPREAAV